MMYEGEFCSWENTHGSYMYITADIGNIADDIRTHLARAGAGGGFTVGRGGDTNMDGRGGDMNVDGQGERKATQKISI